MRRYTYIIGDNVMYHQTVLRRVRWFNFLWVRAGLCNVQQVTVRACSEMWGRNAARIVFKAVHHRSPHCMGEPR